MSLEKLVMRITTTFPTLLKRDLESHLARYQNHNKIENLNLTGHELEMLIPMTISSDNFDHLNIMLSLRKLLPYSAQGLRSYLKIGGDILLRDLLNDLWVTSQ